MLRIAVAGRPNTGKSSLFNRLLGKRIAIVEDTPGVTRDWLAAPIVLGGHQVELVDTAGLESLGKTRGVNPLTRRIIQHNLQACQDADLIWMVVDASVALTPEDKDLARHLRRLGVPILAVANKAERGVVALGAEEATATLGFGAPVRVSATHGEGLADLAEQSLVRLGLEAMVEAQAELGAETRAEAHTEALPQSVADSTAQEAQGLEPSPQSPELEPSPKPQGLQPSHKPQGLQPSHKPQESEGQASPSARLLNLAVVGRPNVGKSTLVNALLGTDRLLVSDEAGTTRDAIAVSLETEAGQLQVTDTAGLRRSAKATGRMEYLSRLRSHEALEHAEQVWLVVDGTAALSKQDLRIATQTMAEGRALLVVVNRTDLTASREAARLAVLERLQRSLSQAQGITVVAISAKTGQGLQELLAEANQLHARWVTRISTGLLNRWLAKAVAVHPPPAPQGKRIRIKYVTQYKARPPSFSLFTSQGKKLPASYLRYLEKDLRATFALEGVPIRLHPKTADNPYQSKRKKR